MTASNVRQRRMVIPGGSGFVGRSLAKAFARDGWKVVILSRAHREHDFGTASADIEARIWNGATLGDWAETFEGADAIVNLAGRSVNCRYTDANRAEIYASRTNSTAVVGAALATCTNPPPVWLNASSATVYRHAEDRPMDEATGEIGGGFSPDVVLRWEKAFFEALVPDSVRRVALRMAMVFGAEPGGVLDEFRKITRLGLGGAMGSGRQYVSWIHADDLAQVVHWCIAKPEIAGILNVAAPNPLPNREMMRVFRETYHRPFGLPALDWMIAVGAFVLQTEPELLRKSRRAIPARLLESGFVFEFPTFAEALRDLATPRTPGTGQS